MSNVINLVPRLKTVAAEPIATEFMQASDVMSFDELRQKMLFQERREVNHKMRGILQIWERDIC